MSRSTKIKISIPEEFTRTSIQDQEKFLFDYLKSIGFSKQNFQFPIEIDEHLEAMWEYNIEKLPEIQAHIELDKLLGAYYLIHRINNEVLPYKKLCEIIVATRGGLSIYHFKQRADRSQSLEFRDTLINWADMVLNEPKEDLDIEVRRAEFRQYVVGLDKLSKKTDKNSTIYVTLTRPQSPARNMLALVEKKLTEIQNEQNNTK